MNNPLDVSPSKGNQGTTRGKRKLNKSKLNNMEPSVKVAKVNLERQIAIKPKKITKFNKNGKNF